MSILDKIFGDANKKYVEKIQPLVGRINSLEPEFGGFSDEQIKEKTREFKKQIEQSPDSLNEILPLV